jgi:uncharacterized protein (TIGR02246 family)
MPKPGPRTTYKCSDEFRPTSFTVIDDIEAIQQSRSKWVNSVKSGEIADYLEILTDDVVWFPPGQPALSGKEAFASWIRPFMQAYDYRFEIREPRVTIVGECAIERGSSQSIMTLRSEGRSGSHCGTYLVFWRKMSDGEWRIERYVDEAQLPGSAA